MADADPGYSFQIMGYWVMKLPDPFGKRLEHSRYCLHSPDGAEIASGVTWAELESLIASVIARRTPNAAEPQQHSSADVTPGL